MRLLFGAILLFAYSALADTCYLSETGKTIFQSMKLEFCDVDTCVSYTKLDGKSGTEVLKFKGCGGRWCLEESKSFTWIFPSAGRATEYVGKKGDDEVYLICPP